MIGCPLTADSELQAIEVSGEERLKEGELGRAAASVQEQIG